jgi:hypothetical protein
MSHTIIALIVIIFLVSVNAKLFSSKADGFGPCIQTYKKQDDTVVKNLDQSCLPMFTKPTQEDSGMFCRAVQYTGKVCSQDSDCDGAGVVTTCINQKCEFINRGLGDKCKDQKQCGTGACSASNVCAELPDGVVGCNSYGCPLSKYCDGTCKPKKSAGSTCNSNIECVDGSTCFNGQCRTRASVGGQCIVNEDCSQDNYCDASVCAVRKIVDSLCTDDSECDASLACIGSSEMRCKSRSSKYKCQVGSTQCGTPQFCSCGADSPSSGWCVPDKDFHSEYEFELLNILTYIHEKELLDLSTCMWTKCGLTLKQQSFVAIFDEDNCVRRQCSSLFNGLSDKLVSDLKTIGVTLKTVPTGDSGSVAESSATTISLSLLVIIMSIVLHLI